MDQLSRSSFRDAEAATLRLRERRDRDVCVGRDKGREVSAQVGIAQKQRTRGGFPLRKRQRLALATTRKTDDARTGVFGNGGGRVARAVIGDNDLRVGEGTQQLGDSLRDALLLVPSGDEDREPGFVHTYPRGGNGGRMPSVAAGPTP